MAAPEVDRRCEAAHLVHRERLRTDAAVDRQVAVGAAVNDEHRHRPRRPAALERGHLAGDDGDRGKAVGERARDLVRHHPAVRDAGRIDASAIDRDRRLQIVEQRDDERHLVDALLHRMATAGAGIPGLELAGDAARALRIDHDEALGFAFRAHPALPAHRVGRAAAAVEDDDGGKRPCALASRRQIDLVAPLARADAKRALDRLGCRAARRDDERRRRERSTSQRARSSHGRVIEVGCRPRPRGQSHRVARCRVQASRPTGQCVRNRLTTSSAISRAKKCG